MQHGPDIADSSDALGIVPVDTERVDGHGEGVARNRGDGAFIRQLCDLGQHALALLLGLLSPDYEAVALTADVATMTSVANDYDFATIFARQLQGLASAGDVAFGLSTSGNSPNVLRAVEFANGLGMKAFAVTGYDGGQLLNGYAELLARMGIFASDTIGGFGHAKRLRRFEDSCAMRHITLPS